MNTWWIPVGIVTYLMVGGVIARVEYLHNIRGCCTIDSPCDKHKKEATSEAQTTVFLWLVFTIIMIPALACILIGDGVDYLLRYPAIRAERNATRRV